jgi:hypothetical protein
LLSLLLLAAASGLPRLTANGWGAVRIGMTREQVSRALHSKLTGEALDDADACIEMQARKYPTLYFMFEDKHLTRISIGAPSRIVTERGIGVGASADAVRKAYPRGLKAEKNYYEDLPAEYLTYWAAPKSRGIRFETDSKHRVQAIHAGTDAIEYVEGCA